MKKISIIIPCYNSYKYMKHCLENFENQTTKNFELIIIDDCSTDDTYFKLLEYKNKSFLDIKIFKLEKNSGPGIAKSKGVKLASCEYIMFCDSDDWYETSAIEKITSLLENKNLDIILYDYNKIVKNKKIKADTLDKIEKNFNNISSVIAKNDFSFCCMCIKKELFSKVEIPNLYNGEDVACIPLILSQTKNIDFIKEALYNYYFRENSISNEASPRISKQLLIAFNYLEKSYFLENDLKEFLGIKIVLYGVTLNLFKLKKFKEIKDIILNFENKYPNWEKNNYLKELNISKKIYLYFIRKKLFFINFLFSEIHKKLLN